MMGAVADRVGGRAVADPPSAVPPGPFDGERPHVFVSYASGDRERALAVVGALERAGVRVWVDRAGIPGGVSVGALLRR